MKIKKKKKNCDNTLKDFLTILVKYFYLGHLPDAFVQRDLE